MNRDIKKEWQHWLLNTDRELAIELWNGLIKASDYVPIPQAGPTEEGYQFAWDNDRYHLDIEIFRGKRIEWFYRDREKGKCADGEGDISTSLKDVVDKLVLFGNGIRVDKLERVKKNVHFKRYMVAVYRVMADNRKDKNDELAAAEIEYSAALGELLMEQSK